jgi:N,N'-diacetyllegionaminate synthase
MSRTLIVAELATGHGGDVGLAGDMIRAAADAGADLVKIQSYSLEKLNWKDPQADWLRKAWLSRAAHEDLLLIAQQAGIELFSTPFDVGALTMLRELGFRRFKIASTEARSIWWQRDGSLDKERWVVSWPWGLCEPKTWAYCETHLTAIPLYPTPLEAVSRATLLDGWSDHCVGLSGCQYALAYGATMLEVHFTLPGKSRQMVWDKTPDQVRQLREFADQMETIHSGVSQVYRERWRA